MSLISFGLVLVGALIGAGSGYALHKVVSSKRMGDAKELSTRIIEEARKEAQAQKKEIILQGQDEIYKQKREIEREFKDRENEVKSRDRKVQEQSERVERKREQANQKEQELLSLDKDLTRKERKIEEKMTLLDSKLDEQELKLQEVSGLTTEEAKERLFTEVEARTKHEAAKMIRQIEMEAKETANRKSQHIIATAIQRYAGDYVGEQTVTAVTLPSEDMKGRIIGREGRNIRAIEAATGVDLIIDDTPETVILSAYSPLRRQIAKMALERLISDGRIHPARIEDVVNKVQQELEVQLREVGEQATFDAGVHGIHPELIKTLGQLKYRTSFSQNVLQHSLEVSSLCGMMAAELGLDIKKAKRAGLLHDLGKAVDHEVEGPHALIGADLAKNTVKQKISSTLSRLTTRILLRQPPLQYLCKQQTPFPVHVLEHVKNFLKTTLNVLKNWKASRLHLKVLQKHTQFRQAEKSESWSTLTISTTIPPTCSVKRLRKKLKTTSPTLARFA